MKKIEYKRELGCKRPHGGNLIIISYISKEDLEKRVKEALKWYK